MALVVFYMPIFPLGAVISVAGLLLLYAVEKYNTLHFYRRPEKIDGQITLTYVKYFRFIIFIYAIAVYIFIGDIYKKTNDKPFHLIAIILFGCLCIVPVNSVFKFFSFLDMSDFQNINYLDMYFEMGMTYEMANPITKNKGFELYLDRLRQKNIINDEEYREGMEKIATAPSDIIELYYQKKYEKTKAKKPNKKQNKLMQSLLKNSKYSNRKTEDLLKSCKTKKNNLGKGLLGNIINKKKEENVETPSYAKEQENQEQNPIQSNYTKNFVDPQNQNPSTPLNLNKNNDVSENIPTTNNQKPFYG